MARASDEQVSMLIDDSVARIREKVRLPQFTAGMAEANVFNVVGLGDVVKPAADAVRTSGAEALARVKTGLAERFGARNPDGGWIGFVMFAAVMAAALSAAFSSGIRGLDAEPAPTIAIALAVIAAVCEIVALAGSRMRPMNRFALRMQVGVCAGLLIAVALSAGRGLTSAAIIQGACAVVAIGVALTIVVVRGRDPQQTVEIDECLARAYLAAIDEVEADGLRAQAALDAALDPGDAALVVRVRNAAFTRLATEVPALADVDPLAPAGAAIIATHTNPDAWLPPAVAKKQWAPHPADPRGK